MTRRRLLLLAVLCGILLVIPVSAQKITGDIDGNVTDPSGAAVVGATITAKNDDTGYTRSTTTNQNGGYRVVELPPGRYTLTVEAQGFSTQTRHADVSAAVVTHADFGLKVGGAGETITVEDVAPLVETTENRVSTVIEARRVEDLPLNGRDFQSLLTIVPGVQRAPGGGFLSLTINGQRSTNNNFAVDGIPNNDRYYGDAAVGQTAILGTAATLVPLEGIQEFQVQGNPGAEFGVKGGAVVNVGLKSGTNDFHGQAFWVRHTDAFDAKNFFNCLGDVPQEDCVTPFKLNQWGGILGGPIFKDKTHFMVSYQRFTLGAFFPYNTPVPTPGEVAAAQFCVQNGGDGLDATPGTADDCLLAGPGPGSDQIFGTGDDGTVNQGGANLLGFYPTDPSGVLTVNSPNELKIHNFHAKLDHIFNDNHRLSLKYLIGDSFQTQPAFAGTIVPPAPHPPDLFNSIAPSRAQLGGASWTWTLSPTKVLETRFGATRFSQIIDVNNKINPADLGIDTGPLDPADFGVPALYYFGYFGYIGGVGGYPITTAPNATWDVQSHFTWIKGNHTFKMGGQWQDAYTKSLRNRARTVLAIYPYFDPAFAGTDDYYSRLNIRAVEQLLLGLFDTAGRSFGDTHRRISQDSFGFYFQDQWKITPNFNLELGLRYDISTPLGEENDQGANFLPGDPEADALGFVPLSARSLYQIDKNNFGPRIGFAWDPWGNAKVVFRGGYSATYDQPNFGTIHAPQVTGIFGAGARGGAFTQPAQGVFGVQQEFASPGDNQALFFNNALCGSFVCAAPGVPLFGSAPTPPTFNVLQVQPDLQTARLQNWNFSTQIAFGAKTSLTMSYVGGHGDNLIGWRDLNASPLGSGGTGGCTPGNLDDFQFRPFFTQFGEQICHIVQVNDDGYSRYHALQTSYQFRNLRNLSGQVNLTWSAAHDTGSANRGSSFNGITPCQNPYNIDCNYARADHDVPLNFNVSFVYDVPRWDALPRLVGEGWQFNTLFQAVSGRPFSPRVTFDESGQGLSGNRADYSGDPINYDYRNFLQFFNADAFFDPAAGTIGNAGRNTLRGPELVQWDASVFKNFNITERYKLQFRWEVFNVLNRANFAIRTGNINSSSFGRFRETADVAAFNPVLGTGAQRNMQFGLKFIF